MKKPSLSPKESQEFNKSIDRFISDMCDQKMLLVSSPENRYTVHHGTSFNSIDNTESELTKHSVTLEYKFEDIRNYNIEQFYKFIHDLSEEMSSQMTKSIYETLGASCDKIGNTIDAMQMNLSNAEAFLEMLKKIEFGVDKYGNVIMPQLHLHPNQSEKFVKDIESQTQEYHRKVEEIKQEKCAQAIEKEKQRLSKFEGITLE